MQSSTEVTSFFEHFQTAKYKYLALLSSTSDLALQLSLIILNPHLKILDLSSQVIDNKIASTIASSISNSSIEELIFSDLQITSLFYYIQFVRSLINSKLITAFWPEAPFEPNSNEMNTILQIQESFFQHFPPDEQFSTQHRLEIKIGFPKLISNDEFTSPPPEINKENLSFVRKHPEISILFDQIINPENYIDPIQNIFEMNQKRISFQNILFKSQESFNK